MILNESKSDWVTVKVEDPDKFKKWLFSESQVIGMSESKSNIEYDPRVYGYAKAQVAQVNDITTPAQVTKSSQIKIPWTMVGAFGGKLLRDLGLRND